ncbi:MAG: guanylate kinase [Gammaproteobacteria bacterium]|nr:guanylate kinase [Gammaproteobacteria bacterium]
MSNVKAGTGTVFVVSAPSGAGKTSLVRNLVRLDPGLRLSVSHTTRPRRDGEQDGVHYHFTDDVSFDSMIAKDAFLEHAKVYGNQYGTAQSSVESIAAQGLDVVLEIDWQGARQVRHRIGNSASVFILPPSLEQLHERLATRGQDSPEIIARRLAAAAQDIAHHDEFDYIVVNDDFDLALRQIQAIVSAERLRRRRQLVALRGLLQQLLAGGNQSCCAVQPGADILKD